MSDSLIVDSNILIDLLDGDKKAAKVLMKAVRILVPAVVCGEFDVGILGNTKREVTRRAAFDQFLAIPRVSVYPVTQRTGLFYAKVYTYCQSTGRPIPVNDIWIAAMALETGATVLTNDRHLLALPMISVQKVD